LHRTCWEGDYVPNLQCSVQEWNLVLPDAGALLTKAASYLRSQKRYLEAELIAQRALAIQEQALGSEHPDVATTLHRLGLIYSGMGKYELSETFSKRALAIRQKVLGPDDPETLSLINDLGYLYYKQGEPQLTD
jgi:tetratricopeptide (TPR) repeat protein